LSSPRFMICRYNSDDFVEADGKKNTNGVRFLVMEKPKGTSLHDYYIIQNNDKSELRIIIKDLLFGISKLSDDSE